MPTRRSFLASSLQLAAGLTLPSYLPLPRRQARAAEQPLDVLILGGTVIDGTGAKRTSADVGIRGNKIVAVGRLAGTPAAAQARRTIDATGYIVAPGFIDMHTHSDRTLITDGSAQSAVRQGATTHVTGNCGSSLAPRRLEATPDRPRAGMYTFGEYLAEQRKEGLSVNMAALVGHNTVRTAVFGSERRPPDESEMTRMKDLVVEAMRAGAIGMSTGLITPPGTYANTEEIIELAKVVAKHGGIYASHIRGEAGTLIDAVAEALRIGREAKLPVQISHHKAAGQENWGKTRITLKMIEDAVAAGQHVRFDVYPYAAGSAGLTQFIPPWAHDGGTAAMLKRLRDPETRKRIAHDMEHGSPDWANFYKVDWDAIQIARVQTEKNQRWVGKRVGDVARDRGISGIEACIELILEEQANVAMINFIINEEEMRNILRHPLSLIGSDGTAVSPDNYPGQPHPRFYGCFPRVLGVYCRQEQLFDLETAIHKMTGASAQHLGLADRGQIRPGAIADVVVFSADEIIDTATFDNPHQFPRGIRQVLANGQLVVDGDRHTGQRPGELLRRQGQKPS